MVIMVVPDPAWRAEWLAFAREFTAGDPDAHVDGSAMAGHRVDDLARPTVFDAWVEVLLANERGEQVAEGFVASTTRWVVEGERIVGLISLRHELNDSLLREGGHIGYAVRPADRGRGVASAALALMLDECRRLGIDPVLVTCDEDNAASRRVIEKAGGVLEDIVGGKRRYWIPLDSKD